MQAAAKDCDQPGFFVMDCSDWQIIPAENLVAAFQVFHLYSQAMQLQQDFLEPKHQGFQAFFSMQMLARLRNFACGSEAVNEPCAVLLLCQTLCLSAACFAAPTAAAQPRCCFAALAAKQRPGVQERCLTPAGQASCLTGHGYKRIRCPCDAGSPGDWHCRSCSQNR